LDGYATGHFSGIRGPWHTPQHGNPFGRDEDSAPITCQTCHYETTDPANVGPDGFYWLDTTGDYHVPNQIPEGGDEEGYLCANCHNAAAPGNPAPGVGQVLPLRHVNGKRDVKFDPREDLPQDIPWLPADPTKKPSRPIWFTNASKTVGWPTSGANITWSSATSNPTRSWSLSNAIYDPATKSCSNTSCHLQFEKTAEQPTRRPDPVWGAPVGANGGWDSCCNCHTGYCF
jgi:predicted CxxxxCH...CXXCH cytochrome family protein